MFYLSFRSSIFVEFVKLGLFLKKKTWSIRRIIKIACCAGNNQRKNVAMLDSSDDNSSVSSSSTIRSDLMSVSGSDDVQVDKDSLLEQALDALYEKRFVSGFYLFFMLMFVINVC